MVGHVVILCQIILYIAVYYLLSIVQYNILYDYIVFYNLQYDFSLPMHLYIGYSADSKSYEWSFHFRNITLCAEDLNATLFAMEGVTEAQKDVLRAKPNQICTWNPKANHLNNCCFNWDGLKSLLINRHPLNLGFQVSHIFYVKSSKLDHRFLLSLKWCGYTETAAMSPMEHLEHVFSFFGGGGTREPWKSRIIPNRVCFKSYSFHALGTWSHGSKERLKKRHHWTIWLEGFFGSMGKFYRFSLTCCVKSYGWSTYPPP